MSRPGRIVQTSKEVKKSYKRNGPAHVILSEQQRRELERAIVLDQRAANGRAKEQRRKENERLRKEKERRDLEARIASGLGLATQMVGYSLSQAKSKKVMESFLGYEKRRINACGHNFTKANPEISAAMKQPASLDGCSEIEIDLLDLAMSDYNEWTSDDLDDDALLEAHDRIMSDPIHESSPIVALQQSVAPIQPASVLAPASQPLQCTPSRDDVDFKRVHGPVNTNIEVILDQIPGALTELLSDDVPTNPAVWNAAPALLYKLNPTELPPHRLRIKVGCIVTLLRNSNNEVHHFCEPRIQIRRVADGRLEGLVIDGELKGTEMFLTRVTFHASHRNLPFQRTQFPLRVSHSVQEEHFAGRPDRMGSSFDSAFVPCQTTSASNNVRWQSATVNPDLQADKTPIFKLPGLPASKTNACPVSVEQSQSLDDWADIFESSTQVARDISAPLSSLSAETLTASPLLSSDDSFDADDFDDVFMLDQVQPSVNSSHECKFVPYPSKELPRDPVASDNRFAHAPYVHEQMAPPKLFRELEVIRTATDGFRKSRRPSPSDCRYSRLGAPVALEVPSLSRDTALSHEFGISTQEAALFFDDDIDNGD